MQDLNLRLELAISCKTEVKLLLTDSWYRHSKLFSSGGGAELYPSNKHIYTILIAMQYFII